jgi:4-carboxymuconolactone decarboxylase
VPRVKLLNAKEDVAPEHHALYDELAAMRGRLSGPASVVMYSPALSKPWNDQSEFLHRETIVEHGFAELAICAAARERDCPYIWNAHAKKARKHGIAEATITATRDNAALDGLPPQEAAVVSYARQLLRGNRVDQATFDALLNAHGAQWLVELTGLIGRYAALAGILNSFEVLPKADAEPLPVPMPNAPRSRAPVAPPLATPRLVPLIAREQVSEAHRATFDAVAKARGVLRAPFGILMHSPKFCMLVSEVSRYMRHRSLVNAEARELCVIAVAREKDCPYVWASHVVAARKAGVSEQAIAAVRDRLELASLNQNEADIIDYVRQLHRSQRVTQALFDRLCARHGIPWLVELTALIGHYGMVTAQLNAFEVAPRADGERLPL